MWAPCFQNSVCIGNPACCNIYIYETCPNVITPSFRSVEYEHIPKSLQQNLHGGVSSTNIHLLSTCRGCSRRNVASSPTGYQSARLRIDVGQGRIVLLSEQRVDASICSGKGITSERRLVVSLAQKVKINNGGEERVLKCQRSENNPNKDEEFGVGHCAHSGVIVVCGSFILARKHI